MSYLQKAITLIDSINNTMYKKNDSAVVIDLLIKNYDSIIDIDNEIKSKEVLKKIWDSEQSKEFEENLRRQVTNKRRRLQTIWLHTLERIKAGQTVLLNGTVIVMMFPIICKLIKEVIE